MSATGPQLLGVLGVSLLAVAVVMASAFAIGAVTGKYSIIDALWGPGFVVIALVSFLISPGAGDRTLRLVVLAAVAVWGLRLGGHILWRNRGLPEDARYVDMLAGSGQWAIARKVQLPQGLAMWFVSIPVQLAMVVTRPVLPVVWIGLGVFLVGFAFESIGDAQLARFKADPSNKGALMNRGLWSVTRHPNYFGDSAVWWGLFIMVSWSWIGWASVLSPLLMTYLLVAKTGKALTEKRMSGSRPGYADYVVRTSGFFPWPPKKGTLTS